MENFKTNTELEMVDYISIVNDIVAGYFDNNGNYQPHIGKINAMIVFYNICIPENSIKLDENLTDTENIANLIKNKNFIAAFNAAITSDNIQFDFANAYSDAMDMVNYRKSSLINAMAIIGKELKEFTDVINPLLASENKDRKDD